MESDRIEFVSESNWRRLVVVRATYSDEAEYTCKCEGDQTTAALTVGGTLV